VLPVSLRSVGAGAGRSPVGGCGARGCVRRLPTSPL